MAVTLRLDDDLDVSRGSMICGGETPPIAARSLEATVCWMSETASLQPTQRIGIKHTTRTTRAIVEDIAFTLDVNTLAQDQVANALTLNDIGGVRLRTLEPLFVDPYERNRTTGSFILIDEATSNTLGAGMVVSAHA